MRCFIALSISDPVKRNILEFIDLLKRYDANVRWLSREGIHITLKFLGDVDESKIVKIEDSLRTVSAMTGRFSLEIRGAGVFPDFSRPGVLWVGAGESEKLTRLHSDMEEALCRIGFSRDKRRFRPHVTIGRVKSPVGIRTLLKELRSHKESVFGTIDIKEVDLMKSTLKPSGAVYERIFSAPLGKED